MRRYKVLLILLLGWMVLGLAVLWEFRRGSAERVPADILGREADNAGGLVEENKTKQQADNEGGLLEEEKGKRVIMVRDVRRYLNEPGVPARQGDTPFTWSLRSGTLPDGEGAAVPVEAAYERSYNGFTLGYVLSATIDPARLKKAAITDDDLRDIRIRYHDDWTEASRLDAGAVDGLIADLRGRDNRLAWHGTSITPGGEWIQFSRPMRMLMVIGAAARPPLHRLLNDDRIQNEVALILGAIGDETTVPLLINHYPRKLADDDPYQTKMVCFSFALSYLTGQEIDRDREGTTLSEANARRWRAWWTGVGPTFRVPVKKPNATWLPSYPILTQEWAVRARSWFVNEP
jgi:hypothetical protein